MLTINSRVVNAHFSTNFAVVALSQVFVSIGYFTIVKNIQGARGWRAKLLYGGGGSIGAVLGVIATQAIR
jgi:hypothetical protein